MYLNFVARQHSGLFFTPYKVTTVGKEHVLISAVAPFKLTCTSAQLTMCENNHPETAVLESLPERLAISFNLHICLICF